MNEYSLAKVQLLIIGFVLGNKSTLGSQRMRAQVLL